MLYEPETQSTRSADIIFIHGLGGTSLRTWCYNRDLDFLWPQLWLPGEEGFSNARVLTYGYNAHFSSSKEQASLSIGDFANDLLFRMRYGESGPARLGQVPIVVVAHSMGGLVFKKAFIHGLLNEEFRTIISMIKAVLFLATPHRGTSLAEALNKILTTSIFGHTSKEYLAELARKSPTIDELNESFRHHASKLKLFSFYETLTTSKGPVSALIVERDTGVLGYPGETLQPLNANHHDVCKYKTPQDSNYLSVLGALRSVVAANVPSGSSDSNFGVDLKLTKAMLGLAGPPEEDVAAGRAVRKAGTCESFLSSAEFITWRNACESQILWAHAGPGSGKSTLCSVVIDRLVEQGEPCCYYFFKHDHVKKRSVSSMLRSLALQSACQQPGLCRTFAEMSEAGTAYDKAKPSTIWKELYLNVLADHAEGQDIYWVIDAIDEADSGRQVVELLSAVGDFSARIHVLLLSRPYPQLSQALQKAKRKVPVREIALPDNTSDIHLTVAEEIEYLPSTNAKFREQVVAEITERSHGNFLWASLVVQQVANCHRQEQIRRVLDSAPEGMDSLYERMVDTISKIDLPEDLTLAKILLSWAMYARRPLTVDELSGPYSAELKSVMDLKHTISEICGGLVIINASNRVTLVHHSAKEYLEKHLGGRTEFALETTKAHEELLGCCLVSMCEKDLRKRLHSLRLSSFFQYAATSWTFHLEHCSTSSDRVLNGIVRFFKSQAPLSWIQYLAMSGHLASLPGISRKITHYVRSRRKRDADISPMLHRIADLELVETWAIDLQKVAVKFGRNLSQDPSMIFKCVPALCPLSSAIFQRFASSPTSILSILGHRKDEWDDCMARVSSSAAGKALRLASSTLYLAIAAELPRGAVTVWDTTLFREFRTLHMNQRISDVLFNRNGSMIACCGTTSTCIWKVKDGTKILVAQNPLRERAIELRFDETDCLYMVTDIRGVYRLAAPGTGTNGRADCTGTWEKLNRELLEETALSEGIWLGTPTGVAFDAECSRIAVAYKGIPPAIWSLEPPRVIARLPGKRKNDRGIPPPTSYSNGSKVAWHPSGNYVLGIHGDIFKWDPLDDAYFIVQGETGITPSSIECSPNGVVFITGDAQGSIKIYDVSSMSLIYRLTSEDSISRICFSPDSLRFFDLRGSYCNVWEPNCLGRLADASLERFNEDSASTNDSFWSETDETLSTSISLPVSESHADRSPAVTAAAAYVACGSARLVVYATEDGSIELFDAQKDRTYSAGHTTFGAIVMQLACSNSSSIAIVDSYGVVSVKKVVLDGDAMKVHTLTFKTTPSSEHDNMRQLLFHPSGDHLLVNGGTGSYVLSLEQRDLVAAREVGPGKKASKCALHPYMNDALILLSTSSVIILDWKLNVLKEIPVHLPAASTLGPSLAIDTLISAADVRHLVVRIASTSAGRAQYLFAALPMVGASVEITSTKFSELPEKLVDAVEYVLGVLPGERLVFVDKGLWVCSASLADRRHSISRHFFIPHDWITDTGLLLCRVLQDGTILCPTKGRISVMKSDLVPNWA